MDQKDSRAFEKHSTKYRTKHKYRAKGRRSTTPKKHRDRPQSHKRHGQSVLPRQSENIMNQDQIEHQAFDFSVTQDLYKNGAAPRYRLFWGTKLTYNPQKHDKPLTITEKKELSKYVNLSDIYEYLYLGNLYFAQTYIYDNDLHLKFDIIINLSGTDLAKMSYTKIYNFDIEDSPFIKVDRKIIERVINIIKDAEFSGKSILINCKAGTNRSPFFVILYALTKDLTDSKWASKVNFWIEYVEKCKVGQGFENWDTLTNRSYVNNLLCFSVLNE